jgi:hypothetical protein
MNLINQLIFRSINPIELITAVLALAVLPDRLLRRPVNLVRYRAQPHDVR